MTQGSDGPLTGMRVLLVDDDAGIREAFQLVLERSGALVLAAASAGAAFAALESFRPDVLLSDLAMPGESGYHLMERVARCGAVPPAAALTAHVTEEGREEALRAGFRLYLGKPLDANALVAAVAQLGGRKG